MLTRASMLGCIPDMADLREVDSTSVVLSVLPMFYVAGAGTSLATLWACVCLVIDNDARPAAMLAGIDRHGVTNLILASVMLQMIVDSPASSSTDLSRIRTVSYGAAPITGQILQAAIKLFQGHPATATTTAARPTRIVQAYGLTETTGVLCVLEAEDHRFDPEGPAVRTSGSSHQLSAGSVP